MAVDLIKFEKQLKAVANKRRLAILGFLKEKDSMCVGDIASRLGLSFRSTSRHLGILYARNLIDKEQNSLTVYYILAPSLPVGIKEIIDQL